MPDAATTSTDLAFLFRRHLARLVRQLDAIDDVRLWEVRPGITNSAGHLLLHLNGNLREYIGRQMGGVPYVRDRMRESGTAPVPRSEMAAAIAELASLIPGVLERTPDGRWDETFPEDVLGEPLTYRHFVMHLFGHLHYHLGQIDYLRRVLTGDGALPPGRK
jgi:uncharacterized damage-inducible protein DinB